jgi:alanine dehydrogenase
MAEELGIAVRVTQELAGAEVVVTCTTSDAFLLDERALSPGTFVAGVGVDSDRKRELAPRLLRAARVVTDLGEQCARIGDLHHALEAGVMTMEEVHADLAQVVAGMRPGRGSREEITVFDSTGLAIQDVAAATVVYERAAAAPEARRLAFG